MNLQGWFFSLYESVVRQTRRFGLPLALLLCYLTALGLERAEFLPAFDRIEMDLLHRAFGLLLFAFLLLLLYDRLQRSGRPKVGLSSAKNAAKKQFRQITEKGPRHWVDLLFLGGLSLIVLLGLLLHLKTRLGWTGWPGLQGLGALHGTLVWFFLSVILVRYYLVLTRGLVALLAYLRER